MPQDRLAQPADLPDCYPGLMLAALLLLAGAAPSLAASFGLSAPMTSAPGLVVSLSAPALPASALSPTITLTPSLAPLAAPSIAALPLAQAAQPGAQASNLGNAGAPKASVAASKGRVILVQDFSSSLLGNSRTVAVYLPPGYDASHARYPVLYAQDGQNLFDPNTAYGGVDWGLAETCDRRIAAGEMAPAIIVAPYNTDQRMSEYSPVPDPQYGGGRGDLYGRFLAEELKPWIDARLRTRPEPAQTAIMGSSLGGLISLHLALTRPDVFSRAGIVSPSLWWADEDILRRAAFDAMPSPRPRIWADMGTREGDAPAEQAKNVERLQALGATLAGRGWTSGADLSTRVFDGAGHNESSWRARVGLVLKFLFPPDPR